MSSADPAEVSMVVSRDGVTVEKSFEPDDFPVPAIAFVIRAERDEDVTVRISDEVPDQVAAEDIGFHPKYGAEFWSVEDGNIVFERSFEAGEEYTTVYGLRASQTDDVESYMSEPTLEDVDPPLDDAGQVVREVIGDDGSDSEAAVDDSPPSSDDIEAAIAAADAESEVEPDTAAEDDDPVEPLTLNDPTGGGDVEPELEASTADTDSLDISETDSTDEPAESAALSGDPIAALARQIREGAASESDLAALRQALGTGSDGSTDARIKQLQSELADLRAYTSALEEFLDENGDAQQLIEDVTGSIERIDRQLSSVESRADSAVTRVGEMEGGLERVDDEVEDLADELSAARTRVESVETEMDGFSESVDAVERDVTEVSETVEGVQSEVGEVSETVDTVEADVETLYGEVDELSSELSSVHSAVEDVESDVSVVESEVGEVHDSVDELEEDIASVEESLDRVDDLGDRLESLEEEFADAREDLESLSQMREQLSSVFGAQVQGPGDDSDDGDNGDDGEDAE